MRDRRRLRREATKQRRSPEPTLTEVQSRGSLAVYPCAIHVKVLLAEGMDLAVGRGGYFCDLYDSFFEEDR